MKKTTRNLILLLILTVVMLMALIFAVNKEFESSSITLRKHELKRLVDFGLSSIEKYRLEYTSGITTKDEALKKISNQIRLFTYEDELQPNYLFMSTYDGKVLVQPYEPEIEGTNQLDLVDNEGKFIIRELISQAKSEPGYITYKYTPPWSTVTHNKISYVAGLPELECYIGTGMYSADIEQIVKKHFTQTLFFIIITIFILYGSSIAIIFPIILSARIIANSLIEIGDTPLLKAPALPIEKFRKKSAAKMLLIKFSEITEKLAAQNRTIIKTAEEKDKLKTEHINNTEMLMKEMNHRVKNNLQIIISLLRLQLNQNKNKNKEIYDSYLETITRLESISIIHNMLYSEVNYSSISAPKYLIDLVSYIIKSFGAEDRIDVEFDIETINLSIDQAVSLGIITNEVLTNSIKYAFPIDSSGSVAISLKSKNDKYIYIISDNGQGIPAEKLENSKTSLGMSLIKNLSKQLGGELDVNADKGTNYTIIF